MSNNRLFKAFLQLFALVFYLYFILLHLDLFFYFFYKRSLKYSRLIYFEYLSQSSTLFTITLWLLFSSFFALIKRHLNLVNSVNMLRCKLLLTKNSLLNAITQYNNFHFCCTYRIRILRFDTISTLFNKTAILDLSPFALSNDYI